MLPATMYKYVDLFIMQWKDIPILEKPIQCKYWIHYNLYTYTYQLVLFTTYICVVDKRHFGLLFAGLWFKYKGTIVECVVFKTMVNLWLWPSTYGRSLTRYCAAFKYLTTHLNDLYRPYTNLIAKRRRHIGHIS